MSIIDNSCKIIVRNEKSVVAHTTNFCAQFLCHILIHLLLVI
nr:MAG TPA: Proteasome component C7-alpha [Caudoviricetes sp.]